MGRGQSFQKTVLGKPGNIQMQKNEPGLPCWLTGKESTCQCRWHEFDPWFQEDPARLRATKPVHNSWAWALEPTSCNYGSPRSATREATTMRSLSTTARRLPLLAATREKPRWQQPNKMNKPGLLPNTVLKRKKKNNSKWIKNQCVRAKTIKLVIQFSRSVTSNSLWPHGLEHARLPCPSPSPGVWSNSSPFSRQCHPTISSSVVTFSSCLWFLWSWFSSPAS